MVRVVYRSEFTTQGVNVPAEILNGPLPPTMPPQTPHPRRPFRCDVGTSFVVTEPNVDINTVFTSLTTVNSMVFGYFVVPANTTMPATFQEIPSDLHILSPRLSTLVPGSLFKLSKNYTVKEVQHPIHADKNIWVVDKILDYQFTPGDRICFFIIQRGWDPNFGARTGLQPLDYKHAANEFHTPYLFTEPKLNPDYLGPEDPTCAGVHFLSFPGLLAGGLPATIYRGEDTPTNWNSDRDFNDIGFFTFASYNLV